MGPVIIWAANVQLMTAPPSLSEPHPCELAARVSTAHAFQRSASWKNGAQKMTGAPIVKLTDWIRTGDCQLRCPVCMPNCTPKIRVLSGVSILHVHEYRLADTVLLNVRYAERASFGLETARRCKWRMIEAGLLSQCARCRKIQTATMTEEAWPTAIDAVFELRPHGWQTVQGFSTVNLGRAPTHCRSSTTDTQ